MLTLITVFLLIAVLYEAEACSSRRRRPPPPPPPPPGAPKKPPVPPPIVKVVREREQVMSRNNCKQVKVAARNNEALANGEGLSAEEQQSYENNKKLLTNNECLNAEDFEYECEFTIYSEIALTVIYHPTGCGCAFTISVVRPRPRLPDVAGLMSTNAAYDTKVTKFKMVVYDVEADQVVVPIEAFDELKLNKNTTDLIERAVAADPNGDFASITAGFAGTVKEFPRLPDQLNKNDPKNANNVPAIMFSIKQIYKTGAMFVVPCTLEMHTPPNALMSQCQPFRASDPFSYAKRAALDADEVEQEEPVKAWFREFYLFPKQSKKCSGSGIQPKSRYITSFYNTAQCNKGDGFLSFDREFDSDFKAASVVVGSWEWKRTFVRPTKVVWGVPGAFSPLTAVWCLGYSQVQWASVSQFQPTNIPVINGVCSALPANWGAPLSDLEDKYDENHPQYNYDPNTMKCEGAFQECDSDLTLLAFQNRNPRDFSKQPESILLTGPRRSFCTENSQFGQDQVVFDTLTFRGVPPGEALSKRMEDDSLHKKPHEIHMVYSAEHDALMHGRHAPELVHATNQLLRKRGEKPIIADPIANPPHRDNFGLNTATGSVDANGRDGKNSGDHPIKKFPETYAAPLTLDPVQSASEDEPLVYDGKEVEGTPPKFCNDGELGCKCRPETAISQCDHPAVCNALNYCVPEPCPFGEPGCPAHADGSCDDDMIVGKDGNCIYKPSCEPGSIGCVCDAQGGCSTGSCLDNLCIYADDQCGVSSPGCRCNPDDGSCANESSCDEFTGLCLFEACTPGTPGCRCSQVGSPCDAGFECGADGACIEAPCSLGSAGCKCLAGKKCLKKGFECVELDRNGEDTACVGSTLCPGKQYQQARCNQECGGQANVLYCGECDYSRPLCVDPTVQYCNPESYLYGFQPCPCDDPEQASYLPYCSSASLVSLATSAVVAVLALVAF